MNDMETPEKVRRSKASVTYSPAGEAQRSSSLLPNARQQYLFTAMVMFAVLYPLHPYAKEDACTQTADMQIYSNAFFSEEIGDLVGYELALKQASGSAVEAVLFIYEGAPADGVRLPGRIFGKKLTVKGNWLEHQIEYPSTKEVVVTHAVEIDGTVDSGRFRGVVKIGGLVTPDKVRLKHVDRLWVCKK